MFGRGNGRIGEESTGRKKHSQDTKTMSMGTLEWEKFYRGDMHHYVSSQARMGGSIPAEWQSGYPMGRDPRYPAFPKSFTREGGCGSTPYENQRRGYVFHRRPMAEMTKFDRDALAELVQTAQNGTEAEKTEMLERHKAVFDGISNNFGRPLEGIVPRREQQVGNKKKDRDEEVQSTAAFAVQRPGESAQKNQQGASPALPSLSTKPSLQKRSSDASGGGSLSARSPGERNSLSKSRAARAQGVLRPVLGGWTREPVPEGYTSPEEAKRLLEEQRSRAEANVMPLSPFVGLLKAPPPMPSDGDASVAECLGRCLAQDGALVSTPPSSAKRIARQKRVFPVQGCEPSQWRSNYSASYY